MAETLISAPLVDHFAQMNANEKVPKLILADDKMRMLFRDYIAQKVYDEIGDPSDAR